MTIWSRMRSWTRAILGRSRMESEMDAELRFHIEKYAEDLTRSGVAQAEAMRRARLEFGGIERAKEECREARGVNILESLLQDMRYALRVLRKSPVFTTVAILTLALGIGANTAIFSVVYAVVLRPLPYPNPRRLVFVFEDNHKDGVLGNGVSYLDMEEWRKENHVFSELAGTQSHDLTLTGRGEPTVLSTAVVTPQLFSVLGVKPLMGRTFLPNDGVKGAAPVVLLSENLWRSRFGADPKIIGKAISLDKRLFTVVGVMPQDFRYPLMRESQQIWIPVVQDPVFSKFIPTRGSHWLSVVGRLKAGVSLAQAQAEMDAINARVVQEFPATNTGWTVRIIPLQQKIVGNVKTALLVLLGAVGLVLLIACANIANLLLARATSRTKEIAVRIALGAGRARIARQLLTESAVLGILGGAAGVLLAAWGVAALSALLPPNLPQLHAIRVDGGVLGFALLLSVLASLAFGLAPALLAARSDVHANLKEGAGRGGEGRGRRRIRGWLAAGEIALAMALMVAAGLLGRSFAALTSVNPGFNAEHVVKADVSLPQFEYSTQKQWNDFTEQLLDNVQAEPGMKDSAAVVPLPLDEQGFVNLGFETVGAPPLRPGTTQTADWVSVSPGYFHVMEIPLLRGRTFSKEDSPDSPPVLLISEALAQTYFSNQDPIGKKLMFRAISGADAPREIVGVVGNVRDQGLNQEPEPMMYVPYAQAPLWGATVVVRTSLSAGEVGVAIRSDVHKIDKDLPVTDVKTMAEILSSNVAQPRYRTMLLGFFGAIALALAAAGLFGVISYSVSCRTQEIGIRMALGATPGKIMKMMLAESGKVTLLGLAFGIPAALVLARFLSSLLFGVSAGDPLTLAGVAVLLGAVALGASYIPTRRAMRVDPMVALRYE